MKMKGFIACALAFALCCSGCGSGEDVLVLNIDDTQIQVAVIDDTSDYSLSLTKDGFAINGGGDTIDGFLMSVDEAETIQAMVYEESTFTQLSIGNADGFSCVRNGEYQHLFRPEGSSVYVCLTSDESDMLIYAAEECLSFSVCDMDTKDAESVPSDEE